MKLNQRDEIYGRQSMSLAWRAVALMAVGLAFLVCVANPVQAQIPNQTTWTNYLGGQWSGNTPWLTNSPNSPATGQGGVGDGTGGPNYIIVFSNGAPETAANPPQSQVDIIRGGVYGFRLNQLRFGIWDKAIELDLQLPGALDFTNTVGGAGNASIQMGSSNSVTFGDYSLLGGSIFIQTNRLTVTGDGTGTLTIDVPITQNSAIGASALVKGGNHILVLTTTPGYTVGTFVDGGVLIFNSTATVPSNSVTVSNNAVVYFPTLTTATALQKITTNSIGSVAVDSPANVNLTGYGSNVAVIAGANATYAGTYTPSAINEYGLGAMSNITLTVSSVLGDLAAGTVLRLTGGGTVLLQGANSYSGGTIVRDSTTAVITNDNNLGSAGSSLILSNGGILRVSSSLSLGTRVVTIGGNGSFGPSGFNLDSGMNLSIPGVIAGPGSVVVNGSGLLLILNNANTVGGTLWIKGGSVSVSGNSLTSMVVNVGVNDGLSLSNATAFTFGGIAGMGRIVWTNTPADGGAAVTALTLGNDIGTPAVYPAGLTNLTITKVGLNQQMLIGTNMFTTAPVITSGALGFGSTQSFGGITSIVVSNNGALAAGWPMDAGFLTFVGPSAATANGSAALAVDSTNNLILSSYPSLYIGAVFSNIAFAGVRSNIAYNGTITPAGATYRFGGGGGTLLFIGGTNLTGVGFFQSAVNKLTGANTLLVGNGYVGVRNADGSIADGVTVALTTNENWTGGTVITNGGNLAFSTLSAVMSAGQSQVRLVGGTLTLGGGGGTVSAYFTNWITIPAGYTGNMVQGSAAGGNYGNILFGSTNSVLNYFVRGVGNIGAVEAPIFGSGAAGANGPAWADFKGRINVFKNPGDGGTQSMRWRIPAALTNASMYLAEPGIVVVFCNNPANTSLGAQGWTNVIGELSGVAGSFLVGYSVTTRTVTWRIGDLNTDSTYAGSMCSNFVLGGTGDSGGSVNLLKVGTGTFTLLGTNASSWAFQPVGISAPHLMVNGGTLVMGYNYAMDQRWMLNFFLPNGDTPDPRGAGLILSNDLVWTSGGMLGTGNFNMVSLDGAGVKRGITLTTGVANASTTYSGNLTDSGSGSVTSKLVKVGTGVLTLLGTNTYQGGSVILKGTLGFATNFAFPQPPNIKVAEGAAVGLFMADIQPILNSIGPATNIQVAINASSSAESINFQTAGIVNSTLIAAGTTMFSGSFIPFTNVVSMGGGSGATLWYTNLISDALYGSNTMVLVDNTGGTLGLTHSNLFIGATNDYIGVTNTYTGGTIVNSNTLYLAGDGALGSGGLTLTTNTTLRLANTWTMRNPISMNASGAFFQVDAGGWVTMTNPISGVGPLRKTDPGILQINATNTFALGAQVINNVTQQISYVVDGGALLFGAEATVATLPVNSIRLNNGAIGFALPPSSLVPISNLVLGFDTSVGGVAITRGQETATFNFGGAGIVYMSLVAVQNLTYTGAYVPYYLGTGNLGPVWALGAIGGITLNYGSGITNVSGASRLIVGGQGRSFSGTVKMLGNNTYDMSTYNWGGGGALGTGQTIIAAGTLYITNDNQLGRNEKSMGINAPENPPSVTDASRAKGGVQMFPGSNLRVTNDVLLDRHLWFDSTAPQDNSQFGLLCDVGSQLIYTNAFRWILGPNNRGSLSFGGSGGFTWMSYSNMPVNTHLSRMDWDLNGGTVRADWGVAIGTNAVMNMFGSAGVNTALEISEGVYTGRVGTLLNPQGYETRVANTVPLGWSAFGKDLMLYIDERASANIRIITNGGPTSCMITSLIFSTQGNSFRPNPWILNLATATANLSCSNNLDLDGQVGTGGGGGRTVFVDSTNPVATRLTGYILNTTNTMALTKTGRGRLELKGTNLFNGSLRIDAGQLAIVGPGSVTNCESIVLRATNAVFDVSALDVGNAQRDAGGRFMVGAYRGQALAGLGSVNGSVSITNQGVLAPGDTNKTVLTTNVYTVPSLITNNITSLPITPNVGSLVFSNNLIIDSASTLNYDLGTVSDVGTVTGSLGIGGTLNIRAATGLNVNGLYTLFSYGGSLLGNGTIAIGSLPAGVTGATIVTNPPLVQVQLNGPIPDPYSLWATNYLGTSTDIGAGTSDPDGDGVSNTNEFLAGTSPTENASALKITSITSLRGGLPTNTVTWLTSQGSDPSGISGTTKTNAVQGTVGTATGGYTNNFGDVSPYVILTGGTGTVSQTWTDNGGTNKYYRIRLVP